MSQVLKIGIIGVGVMGADHACNLAAGIRGAELVALADANQEAARSLAAEVGNPTVFGNPQDLIDSGEVDAIIIAVPDQFHAELTLACVEKGIPVLCEKPLAPTFAEGLEVVEAVEAAHALVTIGFMRRFDPGFRALKETVAAGSVGQMLMSQSVHRNVEAYPGQDSTASVTNSAVHEFDTLAWLSGVEIKKVQWAAGKASSLISERHDPQLLLLWDANDVLHTVLIQVHAQYGYDVRCELVCEKGSIELPRVPALIEERPVVISMEGKLESRYPADWRPRFAAAYRHELSAWVAATLEGRIPDEAATARAALQATNVAEALVRSMENGGTVVAVPDLATMIQGVSA